MVNKKERIARRVALEFRDGDAVNLGIGLPTLVPGFLPEGVHINLQAENGMLGVGGVPEAAEADWDIHDAGGMPVMATAGCSYFDSAFSFALIRGGHLTATVLGAMEVDEKGNLANYVVPGKKVAGMGGAMDLCAGARRVIIAMEHTTKDGGPKIRRACTLPLTARGVVNRIVTEMGVIDVTGEGLVLREIAADFSVEEVRACTEAYLIVPEELTVMQG